MAAFPESNRTMKRHSLLILLAAFSGFAGGLRAESLSALFTNVAPAVAPPDVGAWLSNAWSVASQVVALASIIAAALPPATPGTPYAAALSVVHWLSMNIFNAKPAPASS